MTTDIARMADETVLDFHTQRLRRAESTLKRLWPLRAAAQAAMDYEAEADYLLAIGLAEHERETRSRWVETYTKRAEASHATA